MSKDHTISLSYRGVAATQLSCLLFGFLLNTIATSFFRQRKFYFAKLFIIVAICDNTILILAVFSAISYLSPKRWIFFDVIFCQAWGSLWRTACICSAHLVAIISVIRTIRIISPLKTRPCNPVIIVAVDLAFLAVLVVSPWLFGERYLYVESLEGCVPLFAATEAQDITIKSVTITFIPMLMFFLPFPLILSSFVVSVQKLIIRQYVAGRAIRTHQRRSFLAIVVFTAAYLLCNLPLMSLIVSFIIKVNLDGIAALEKYRTTPLVKYAFVWSFNVGVVINALVNPLIHLWRVTEFRTFVSVTISRVYSTTVREVLSRLPQNVNDRIEHEYRPAVVTVISPGRHSHRVFTDRYRVIAEVDDVEDNRVSSENVCSTVPLIETERSTSLIVCESTL